MKQETQPRGLTVAGAAAYLGTSAKQIRRLIWSRALPVVRLGKGYVIDRLDLDRWLEASKKTL